MSTSPSSRRFWRRLPLRLSVRTLMVLVLLVGGGVGWIVQRARAQRQAVEAIERSHGFVIYGFAWLPRDPVNGDARPPDWATRFIDAIGPEYVCDVLEVDLSFFQRTNRDCNVLMIQVGQLHQVRNLNLYGCEFLTDAGLAHLRGLTNLEDLNLGDTHVSGSGLRYLSDMTKLRSLKLAGTALRDRDAVHLKRLTKLEILWVGDGLPDFTDALSRSEFLTDAGLANLSGMTNLWDLDLSATRVSGAGLRHLSGMTKLVRLVLPGTAIRDGDLAHLKSLSELMMLLVYDKAPGISDVGLAHLSGLTSLQHLEIHSPRITSAGVEAIRTLRDLDTINLDSSNIADLTGFQYFPKLKELSLSETPVDDAGLASASRLTELTTLNLTGTKVTDAGLSYLQPLKKLTHLRLTETNTSSDAISALEKMPLPIGAGDSRDPVP